jgi:hypothetical protein
MTAVSVPCPIPVHASEPNNSMVRRADFPLNPSIRNSSTKRRAAIIGPTVCELDGPIPILNKSSALINEFSRSVKVGRRGRPIHGALIR